jgi:nucleoside-diphosphate-sugar epimerase
VNTARAKTDIARMLERCVGDERAYKEIFNLSAPEHVTYESLMRELARINGAPFETLPVTTEQVLKENIPLPFPLSGDELFSGEKFSRTFGFSYTPFSEGMEKAFKAFKTVYER